MANVDIIIRSIDQTKGNLTKVSKETNTLAGSLKAVATNAAVVTAAIAIATQTYDKVITQTQKYNQEVLDMMISTKGTAEETSKLIQVVDDAGVSYDTLKNAMKLAIKNGVEPNIEGIAALADEYNSLKDPIAQGQLLMDKFGKSGLEMGRVMVLGGDALRKMSSEMSGGLVLTQDNIDASEEYRKNVDELSDSWKGFVTNLGNKGLPIINQAIENQEDYNRRLQETIRLYGDNGDRANNMRVLLMQEREERIKASDAIAEHGDKLDGIVTNYKQAEDAVTTLNSSYDDLLKNAMSLTSADQDYAKSQQDIKDQQAELMTEKAGLYAWETEKINDVQGKIDDLSAKYDENATEHEKRTQRVLLDMSLEKIAMSDGEAGFSEAEYNKALVLAEIAGVVEAVAIREVVAMDVVSISIANGIIQVDQFKQMFDLLTSKEITLTVNQVTNMLRADALSTQMDNRQQHATGGDFLIPMSYGNEGFQMGNGDTASGGERVSITPKGGVGQPSAPQLTERGIAKAIAQEFIKHGAFSTGR